MNRRVLRGLETLAYWLLIALLCLLLAGSVVQVDGMAVAQNPEPDVSLSWQMSVVPRRPAVSGAQGRGGGAI